jgi:DNA-binding LytR/AlgR family response regulator
VRRWAKWLGFWTLLGVVSSVQFFFAHYRFAGAPPPWWEALAVNLPDWYLWGLLSLVVVWLARRFRLDRESFGRYFVIHLGASLDIALLQLVAAVSVQDLLHAAAGEPYAVAQQLVDKFTIAFHWNVLIYWAIVAVVHALDYHRAWEQRRVPRPADRLLVEDDGRSFFVRTADVDWIEAAKNYVRLHVGDRTHVVRSTLTALEHRLDPERFRRINRSAVVNLDRVHELQPWFHGDAIVILQGGARVTVSRRYRQRLLSAAP